jgi:pSer/pThr/pTyr-binding forkhead associated (FHA) protein
VKAGASPRECPCLIVPDRDGRPVSHLIRGREVTVGRERTNDVCIPNPLVSKHHARLIVSNHSVTVFDLGSANKTRVNGQIVSQAAVGYGDEIQFARVKCRLVLARAPAGPEPSELDPVLSP